MKTYENLLDFARQEVKFYHLKENNFVDAKFGYSDISDYQNSLHVFYKSEQRAYPKSTFSEILYRQHLIRWPDLVNTIVTIGNLEYQIKEKSPSNERLIFELI